MAGTCRLDRPRGLQQALDTSIKRRASTHSSQSDSKLHPDSDPLVDDHRMSVCEELALPVLRVYRLVDPFPALEEWHASGVDVCDLHGAGVGMECVPKHQCELVGGGRLLDHHSRQCVDRDKSISSCQERRDSREASATPTRRIEQL